jgi:predicted anti-sigma-YlaC factor YlaD
MEDINQRPLCHRAEDLVSYLYGEANDADAGDFRRHLQQCDACRSEFAVFNQVHESIVLWRNEALGASFNPAAVVSESTIDSREFARPERKLSALAALREFFTVSPLWLRGATAFAGLLLCALVLFAVSRTWQRPTAAPVAQASGEQKVYTASDFKTAVEREVRIQTGRIQQQTSSEQNLTVTAPRTQRSELAVVRTPSKPRVKGLTRQEREQLAADLRLVPGVEEEELPFELPELPNQ